MSQKNSEKSKFPYIAAMTAAVVLSFALSFFMGQSGILRLRQAQNEYDALMRDNARYVMENKNLAKEIRRLRTDPAMIEKIAREELHYVAPHDVVLITPSQRQ